MGDSDPELYHPSAMGDSDPELYQSRFHPQTYLGYCYQFAETSGQKDNSRFVTFVLSQLSKTFSTGRYRGKLLLEVGTGPTIHTLISACEFFEEIVVSDFVDSNRTEIERWLRAEDGCFDWNSHIQFVCDLEGRRTPATVAETLRHRIRRVLKCDVCLENPFSPATVEPADCLVSSLCLEAACRDRQAYRRSLGAVAGLLGPGGVLVLIGDLGETFYTVGGERFPCVRLSQDFIQQSLAELGFTLQEFTLQPAQDRHLNQRCDYEASYHLIAHKNAG